MKRYTGQKALYEAIARTQAKYQRRGILERLHVGGGKPAEAEPPAAEEPRPQPQAEPVKLQAEPVRPLVEKPAVEKPPAPVVRPVRPVEQPEPQPRPAQSWLRPKAVQIHDGRVEISLPYTIGITVLLAGVLIVLGAFRLGQMQHPYRLPAVNDTVPDKAKPPAPVEQPTAAKSEASAPVEKAVAPDTGSAAPAPAASVKEGDHVIVLAQHPQAAALESAKAYFKTQGIATEVISVSKLRDYLVGQGINAGVLGNKGGYMLVTADYYDNPASPGTNGYKAKLRIKEVGRGYKAPSGSESFAPNYFSDAYGMKVR